MKNAASVLLRGVRRSTSRKWVLLRTSRVFLKIPKCLFDSTTLEEQVFFISFKKCIVNCVRSYRWRWLRASYLNTALVWLKARALWKYNELVLTNHGAHISLNIFINSLKKSHFFEEVLFYPKNEVMAFLNIKIKMRLRASSYEPGWPDWPAYQNEFRLEFIQPVFRDEKRPKILGTSSGAKLERQNKDGETQPSHYFCAYHGFGNPFSCITAV